MNCADIQKSIGCYRDAGGITIGTVEIHTEYRRNAAGNTVVHAVRYTDAAGVPILLGVGETVTPGACAIGEVSLTQTVQRLAAPYTVVTGYKSVSVTAISSNVTIDGVAIPANFTWSVDSSSGERFSDTVAITGTDYIVTEVR